MIIWLKIDCCLDCMGYFESWRCFTICVFTFYDLVFNNAVRFYDLRFTICYIVFESDFGVKAI